MRRVAALLDPLIIDAALRSAPSSASSAGRRERPTPTYPRVPRFAGREGGWAACGSGL